ncbi:hypothetical protein CISIN_1g0168422mg, partial [Citrus sinensis]
NDNIENNLDNYRNAFDIVYLPTMLALLVYRRLSPPQLQIQPLEASTSGCNGILLVADDEEVSTPSIPS